MPIYKYNIEHGNSIYIPRYNIISCVYVHRYTLYILNRLKKYIHIGIYIPINKIRTHKFSEKSHENSFLSFIHHACIHHRREKSLK